MRREVRLAANVDGIEPAEVPVEAEAAHAEVEARGGLQRLNRRGRITRVQREQGPQRRQIHVLHRRILGKVLREVVGKSPRSSHIA